MTNSRSRIPQLSKESGASSGKVDGGAGDILSEGDLETAAALFLSGNNTRQIADCLLVTEAEVYNALAKHREGGAHGETLG